MGGNISSIKRSLGRIIMGGSSSSIPKDYCNFSRATTIVLVGCTGNGKSATGNSILGREAFKSFPSFDGVTNTCEQQSTALPNCGNLNVIDTPGMFNSASNPKLIEKEIVRCIDMAAAKDGIHAILMVVSLKCRFTEEQVLGVEILKHFFGPRIVDYVIVVFTGGDELEGDQTLDDGHLVCAPHALKELLRSCGHRKVVFDNKTKDKAKKADQLQKLISLVDDTMAKNGGKPYTKEVFLQLHSSMVDEEKKKRNEETKKRLEVEIQNLKQELVIVHQREAAQTWKCSLM